MATVVTFEVLLNKQKIVPWLGIIFSSGFVQICCLSEYFVGMLYNMLHYLSPQIIREGIDHHQTYISPAAVFSWGTGIMFILPLCWEELCHLEWNNFPRVTDALSALPQRVSHYGGHHSRMRVLQIKALSHRQSDRIKDWHISPAPSLPGNNETAGTDGGRIAAFLITNHLYETFVSICIPKYHSGKPRQCGWTSALLSRKRRWGDMVAADKVVKQIRC